MWLYYCLLSTVIWGFVAIAIKKCSNNEPKRIAIMGMLVYHCSMILISLITYAVIIIIGIFAYCLITKKWNYIDIRKINNKGCFILQSLLDVSSSIFNRFALLDGNVSIISIISTSSIIITILASRLLLKEKIGWKKYLMILGIFICVLILALIKM